MRSGSQDLKIKLTVTADEHPELHRSLMAIADPRRRTGRLKDLACAGLLVERFGTLPGPRSASDTPAVSRTLDELGDAVSVALWEERAG
jgi:hypothetical protein